MRLTVTANTFSTIADQSDSPPGIELTGILREHGQTFVVFRAGPSERILRVNASDLDSFAAFEQKVAMELGLWI